MGKFSGGRDVLMTLSTKLAPSNTATANSSTMPDFTSVRDSPIQRYGGEISLSG